MDPVDGRASASLPVTPPFPQPTARLSGSDHATALASWPGEDGCGLHLLMAHARTPLVSFAASGQFLAVNPAACSFFGHPEEQLLQMSWQQLAHPQDLPADLAQTALLRAGRTDSFRLSTRFVRPNGAIVSGEMTVVVVRDGSGGIRHLLAQLTDLTAEQAYREALAIELELRRAETRYRAVVENLAEGVVIHQGGRVVEANAAAQAILGLAVGEMDRMHRPHHLGVQPRALRLDGTEFPTSEHPSEVALRTGRSVRGVVMGIERPDRSRAWILINSQPIPDPGGRPTDMVVTSFMDITALTDAQQALLHQAMHDPLTGLPNRALLLEHVAAALRRHDRIGVPLALLFIDLDGFKAVNDEAGHHVGDEILQMIAHRLVSTLRASDIAGRIGGDEFLVICEGSAGEEPLEALAERILRVLPEPVQLERATFLVGASIGIARATAHTSPEELVQLADAAMYAAKRLGGGRFVSLGGASP